MPELTDLLDLASRPAGEAAAVDAAGDLRRGRRALSRVRRRRTAAGLVCAAGVGVVATTGLTGGTAPEPRRGGASDTASDTASDPASDTASDTAADAAPPPKAERITVGPFSFARPPGGWRVAGPVQGGSAATLKPPEHQIGPIGSPQYADDDPDNMMGKITIMLDDVPMVTEPTGERVEHRGRRFSIRPHDSYVLMSVPPVPGDAEGFLYVYFWRNVTWDRATRLAFVDSIRVAPGTVPWP